MKISYWKLLWMFPVWKTRNNFLVRMTNSRPRLS